MAAGSLALIVFVIVLLVIGAIVAVPILANGRDRLDRREKTELKELRATMRRLEILAARNKGINDADSILATQIEDEIYTYKTKELS